MALTYPEGECYFRRSALDINLPDQYHASDPKDFYSHMMVEYVWNRESYHGQKDSNYPKGYTHPRSEFKIVTGYAWGTNYGAWTHLPFSYGPHFSDIRRRVQHELCINGNDFRDREKGGAYQPYFMFVPMPTTEERWVWIDRLSFIRAIYLPVAHSVDKDHPDLCSFVQVSWALDRTIKMWNGGTTYNDYTTDKILGLKEYRNITLGLDVSGLISLLTLPRQLRRGNCYTLQVVRPVRAQDVKTVPLSKSYVNAWDKAWLDVASGNYGLDLMWRPPEKTTWMENYIRNTLTIAVGNIPVVGPLVQVVFSVGWTLISEGDPKAAYELLKNLAPGVDITDRIIQEVMKSAADTRRFLPDGWEALKLTTENKAIDEVKGAPKPIEPMDHTLPMLMQKEILEATGNSPGTLHSIDSVTKAVL